MCRINDLPFVQLPGTAHLAPGAHTTISAYQGGSIITIVVFLEHFGWKIDPSPSDKRGGRSVVVWQHRVVPGTLLGRERFEGLHLDEDFWSHDSNLSHRKRLKVCYD